jgi:cohesin loading factor subunit SCC2
MAIYRSTISVLYHALPLVSDVGTTCLKSIKMDLIRNISRVSRPLLNEVIPCLRDISEILQDSKPLTSLTISCLENIRKMEGVDLQDSAAHEAVQKAMRLLNIAGMCGKHCNFDAELESFRMRCAGWSGNSIAEFMISTFTFFSSSMQPMSVREAALDAICMVCYSWPEHFASATVHIQFKEVFEKDENSLLEIVLKSFKEFFLAIEEHSKVYEDGSNKLGDVAGSGIDRAAAFIRQRFCKYVMEIALATQDDLGLLAVEVLASMNRQGIIHPKECAAICIALETSQNREIAELSFSMHQILHSKFNDIMQRQYLRAVYAAHKYQRVVVRNLRGATCDPYLSVLHRMVEVLNTGKVRTRKKLYQDLCAETDLDLSQTSGLDMPQYLQRSLFILENLAFFEYASVDELDATTTAMEKVFARAARVVTHAIETEVLGKSLPPNKSEGINPHRLCVLAAFSAVLSSIRDTKIYLR